MIQCDECLEWFHGTCVNVTAEEAKCIDVFLCPQCVTRSSCFSDVDLRQQLDIYMAKRSLKNERYPQIQQESGKATWIFSTVNLEARR